MKQIIEQLNLPMWYDMTGLYCHNTGTSCDITITYGYGHYQRVPFWKDWRRIGALFGLIGMFAIPIYLIWLLENIT